MGVLYLSNVYLLIEWRKYQKTKRLLDSLCLDKFGNSDAAALKYYILFDFDRSTLYVAQHAVTQFL